MPHMSYDPGEDKALLGAVLVVLLLVGWLFSHC